LHLRWSVKYDEGLHNFIEFVFATSAQQNRIPCPYRGCGNNYWLEAKDVREHLISIGFMDGYSSWIHHGEGMSSVPSPGLRSQSEDDDAEIDPMEQILMEGLILINHLTKCVLPTVLTVYVFLLLIFQDKS
jgi:hypothetical protein